jgi:hypothetical protein
MFNIISILLCNKNKKLGKNNQQSDSEVLSEHTTEGFLVIFVGSIFKYTQRLSASQSIMMKNPTAVIASLTDEPGHDELMRPIWNVAT